VETNFEISVTISFRDTESVADFCASEFAVFEELKVGGGEQEQEQEGWRDNCLTWVGRDNETDIVQQTSEHWESPCLKTDHTSGRFVSRS
jgi:hypothetical protein